MAGGVLSELSERRILGGALHALPAELYPPDLEYVALGHLHRAQRVGGCERIRYAGSPLPLALDEADYRHQVLLVALEGSAPARVTVLPVPRAVPVLRLPGGGAGCRPEAVPALLEALPAAGPESAPEAEWPWLELTVSLEQPEPGLRAEVEARLRDKAVRLVRLAVLHQGDGAALADGAGGAALETLGPEEVFRRCWQSRLGGEPEPAHLDAFRTLLAALQEGAP
jgi:exonuclease SbcD